MIGILVVAHEPVASSFGVVIRHVLGKTPSQAAWLDVASDEAPDDVLQRVRTRLTELDSGGGVLVCCDICGATPTNVASRLSEPGKVHVVTGLNLPMLLRAFNYRDKSLEELTEKALTGGASGVMRMEPDNAAK